MKHTILILFLLSAVCSCKKDLLRWNGVTRLNTGTTARLNRLLRIDDSVIIVAGGDRFSRSVILRSGDGGSTWSYREFPEAGKALYALCQAPGGRLLAAGFEGKVLISDDTGRSWRFSQSGLQLPIKGLVYFTPNRGVAIGGISFKEGFRLEVDSNFSNQRYDSLGIEMNDGLTTDGIHGYLAGYGMVMTTADRGVTWNTANVSNDNFTSVSALNRSQAWVCGYNGSIFRTEDGGLQWKRLRNGNDLTKPSYHLLSIEFRDPDHGFAAGEDGKVIFTDDGGRHWMEFDRFTGEHLRDLCLLRDGSLLVCGDEGTLFRVKPALWR